MNSFQWQNAPSLFHIFSQYAKSDPFHEIYRFLKDGENFVASLTYADLDEASRRVGSLLQRYRLRGKPCLLLYPPGHAFIEGFFGCLYSGVIAVPAYPPRNRKHMARIESIINDCGAEIILTDEATSHKIKAWLDELEISHIEIINSEAAAETDFKEENIQRRDIAFLQYTSGSVGHPKGVVVTHENLIENIDMIAALMPTQNPFVAVSWLPFYHDMGLIGSILNVPIRRGTLILMTPAAFLQRPMRWLEAITHYRAVATSAPNFAYDICARVAKPDDLAKLDLSLVEYMLNGAEPIRADVLEKFCQVYTRAGLNPTAMFPAYGLAEATLLVTGNTKNEMFKTLSVSQKDLSTGIVTPEDSRDAKILVSSGIIANHLTVKIVDPEILAERHHGVGEIWIHGPSIASGYYNNSNQTKATFHATIPNDSRKWLRSGDLGFLYRNELYVTGRLKDLIIIRGKNHYPQDIELSMEIAHDFLQPGAGAAFSVEANDQERLIVVHEVKHSTLKSGRLKHVAEQIVQVITDVHEIAPYAVILLKTGSIPKTSSGKIQRHRCKQFYLNEQPATWEIVYRYESTMSDSSQIPNISFQDIISSSQEERAEVIASFVIYEVARLLSQDPSTIYKSQTLQSLGLDSLAMLSLQHIIEETTAVHITIGDLSKIGTIFDLCSEIGRRLKTHSQKSEIQFCIASSFTAEPIQESLEFWFEESGLHGNVRFAAYNQVFQELLYDKSLLRTNRGVNLILFRPLDWIRYDSEKGIEDLRIVVADFLRALRDAVYGGHQKWIVALCPYFPLKAADSIRNNLPDLYERLMGDLQSIAGIEAINLSDLTRIYQVKDVYDTVKDSVGHIPYTQLYFTAMGTTLFRQAYSLLRRPIKVIALDCDNTLWQGVCAESAPIELQMPPGIEQFQRKVKQQKQLGKLLCLASKNIEDDVIAVFEKKSMPLSIDDFIMKEINWERKSENLKRMAKSLNLGLDSFLFIDDNPLEIVEVNEGVPSVLTLQLPPIDELEEFLDHFWLFDSRRTTNEDLRRTELYRVEQERKKTESKSQSYDDFLNSLEIELTIQVPSSETFDRCAQLTQKTNQFNTTTKRRTVAELFNHKEKINGKDNGHLVHSVHVKDRFGDYGLVGLIVSVQHEDALLVDSLLMSCRVLGRKVEHSMISFLQKEALKRNVSEVHIPFVRTNRNEPVRKFLRSFGPKFIHDSDSGFLLTLPVNIIESLLENLKAEEPSPNPEDSASSMWAQSSISESKFLNKTALSFRTAQAIQDSIHSKRHPRPNLRTEFVSPRTNLQKRLCEVWSTILRLDRIGIHDDFFQLGGDSLMGAELLTVLDSHFQFGADLSILQRPTVAQMADAISRGPSQEVKSMDNRLADEVVLPNDLVFRPLETSGEEKDIFLTGGTGYYGAFLLAELLKNPERNIHCLVRASSVEDAKHRIFKNLSTYRLWRPEFQNRIQAVVGNLARPYFQLDRRTWDSLAEKTDAIYHNGATVNFVYPYNSLRDANVHGTTTAIRFALAGQSKPLHFISTLGVLMSGRYPKDRILTEDGPIENSEDLPNGYEQSKWVSDRIVKKAIDQGLSASIYRLGMLSGLAGSGEYYKLNEFLPSFLKGCIQMEAIPDLRTKIEMVPIDFTARAMTAISLDHSFLGKTYHLNHPNTIQASSVVEWLQNKNFRIRVLEWRSWKKEFLGMGSRLRSNALYPYLDFIRVLDEEQTYMPEMDLANFKLALQVKNLSCPDVPDLLDRYFSYFERIGFIERNNPK